MDRVEAQEMGIGLGRSEVVEGHDIDVLATALDDGAKNVASDRPNPLIATLTAIRSSLMHQNKCRL
jgi:hypothetical protein